MNLAAELAANAVHLIVNLTLLGASVAAGIALAFRLTRVAPPRARYWVAVAAFAVAAATPLVATFYATRESERVLPISTERISLANQPIDAAEVLLSPTPTFTPPLSVPFARQIKAIVHLMAESPLAIAFLAAWIGVALMLLTREAVGHLMLRRECRAWLPASTAQRQELAWPDEVRLYLDERTGPSAVGWLRPAVVLPSRLFTDLPAEAAQRIARHELAHARWRDPLVNALLRIVRAALWPSFPLWFLARIIHAEREAAADRAAIDPAESSADASRMALDYAASLLLLAQWPKRGAYHVTGTQLGGVIGLEDRVRRLLRASARLTLTRLALGSATLIAGVIGMAFLPITSQPFKSKAARGPNAADEVRVESSISAQKGTHIDAPSKAAGAAATVQAEAMKREALDALATSAQNSNRDQGRDQDAGPFIEAQDSETERSARLAAQARLFERLEQGPDFPLQTLSPDEAPILITSAIAKKVTREEQRLVMTYHQLRYIDLHGGRLEPPSTVADEYTTFPRITVLNKSNRRIISFVLGFQMRGFDAIGATTGVIKLQLDPGESFTYRTQWMGPNFSWPVSPDGVKVIVMKVFFEDGRTWGAF